MAQTILTKEDGVCVLIIRTYESCRQDAGQSGYRVLEQDGTKLTISIPVWKTFQTVSKFLQDSGFNISWREAAWIGYIKFVFKSLSPTVPQPGQLKNRLLVKKYLSDWSNEDSIEPLRTDDQMQDIYRRILQKEISADSYLQALLGVRKV